MKLTIIGSGNMGGALVKGWAKVLPDGEITATAHSEATLGRLKAACPNVHTTTDTDRQWQMPTSLLLP